MFTEKLQKVLARAGLGSRRQIEAWIQEGRVQVNRKTAVIGQRVSVKDDIRLNGRRVNSKRLQNQTRQIICYHKPVGEVCTRRDPEGRPTIFKNLPKLTAGRWITVGRLDINTSGLILLTTDGELANRLMHPSYGLEREYAVRVLGKVDEEMLTRLTKGVELEDGVARFEVIQQAGGEGANHWYHVTIKEGRKREVRRLWESQGITVSRLMRIRYGQVRLPAYLRAGHWAQLDKKEANDLLRQVDLYKKPTTNSDAQTKARFRHRQARS
ncbi:23S rRNA pseudouridine(2605) synthase RluB [Candidatus Albibeggiatoa sp. nov. NOAA]|uniref:23S rRNA pseudouridine(2605) synthase RluB n=1 Tax=Candidatus Albibeggiatoa sp. nov. NOAA TaxID=3162724 RepID=UPI0032F11E9A|nr:23S rRNA pseudouridine(2605) synthase RluB [Thiotrichaceae bacterium]